MSGQAHSRKIRCPWCSERVALTPRGLLPVHYPGYMTGRECHCSGLTPQAAQDKTNESIMRHAATGE